MLFIRQGATHKVVLGPAVAVGDGFTPVTNLDVATADEAEVILHDNGTVVDISGYTWAAIATADGYYHLTLQSGISGTVGQMTVVINDDSLVLPITKDFTVLDTAPYDAMFADAAAGPLQSTVAGRTLDVSTGGEAGIDWANVGTPGSTVDLSATTIDLCDQVTSNDDMRGTDSAALATGLATHDGKLDTAQLDLDTITGAAGALLDTTATSPQLVDDVWDEPLTGGTHNVATSSGRRLRTLQDFGVYEGGAIWIDTVNGAAGTTDYENGTVNNPVDNIADAYTLAASVGLVKFVVLPGSSFTLAASTDGYNFSGSGYTVALGGQSVSGAAFNNAIITGNDDGSNTLKTHYHNCEMGSSTLGKHMLGGCHLCGDLVLAEAADYFWDQCYSAVAGTGTPSVDLQSAAETKNLSIRHYSGGMEFKNFGAGGGTHTASIEGFGQIILNASCAGGTIAARGMFTLTDNAGAAVTISGDARIDKAQILDALTDDATQIDASQLNTHTAITPASSTELATHDGKLDTLTTTVGTAGDGLTEAGGDGDHLTAINLPNQTMDIIGDITGNLSGSVGSVTGAVGSVTGAVGSVTAEVDADIKKINAVTITGTGVLGDEFEP